MLHYEWYKTFEHIQSKVYLFWKIIKYRKWDQLQEVLKVTDGGCNWLIAIEGQYWYYSENSEV